ncbi:MAG: acyltransferase family protein [Pseudomonas sp.]
MHNKNLSYRPDIDGLRALAVLAVVIFHINKDWLPGGFVGVDIFFVISGFLITGIIKREQDKGIFRFTNFYMRRARRILPAALTTIFVTLMVGVFVLLPKDLIDLGKSSIASVLSAANIYFWLALDTSYFADSSETVPLLHMWSLGVEEQFYLIWPALMIAIYKLKGSKGVAITSLFIAATCFLISEYTISADYSFSYYMLPSRAGELLIGAILFLIIDSRKPQFNVIQSNALGLSGLALLGGSLLFISEDGGSFPGVLSAVPSIGAALIIAGGHGRSLVSRLLSARPLVAIGLISFSLYLWHWPVMAFYRYLYGSPSDPSQYIACVSAMVALSLVSYHFVEKKFRAENSSFNVKMIYTPLVAAAISAVSITLIYSNGFISESQKQNFTAQENQLSQYTAAAFSAKFNCQYNFTKDVKFNDPRCVLGDSSKTPDLIMIGDSHSAHYTGYMREAAKLRSAPVYNTSLSACIPFPGVSEKYVKSTNVVECGKFNDAAYKEMEKYKTVMVSANWNVYQKKSKDFESDFENLLSGLSQKGKKVIIGLNVPEFRGYDRLHDIKHIKIGSTSSQNRLDYRLSKYSDANNIIIKAAAKYSNVYVFDLTKMICPNGECSPYKQGRPIYYDGGHLSISGSELLGKMSAKSGAIPSELLN